MILRHSSRHGFSLMEVITALAIFLLSLIALGQLLNLSTTLARDTKDLQRASQLCRSKMNEVVAGAVSLSSQADASFEEDPNWVWSLDCQEDSSISGLWRVTVRATLNRPDGTRLEEALSQYVLDPAVRGTLDAGASTSTSGGESSTGAAPTAPMGGN